MFIQFEVHTTDNPENDKGWDAADFGTLPLAEEAYKHAVDQGLSAILYKVTNGSFEVVSVSTPATS